MKPFFYFIVASLFLTTPIHAWTVTGNVTRVIDGDSLVITHQNQTYEIRLNHIDSPEWKQPYGKTAKKALQKRLLNQEVTAFIAKKDIYGRYLADIVHENASINTLWIKNGHAWCYPKQPLIKSCQSLESIAKSTRQGLWKSQKPLPPWEYRASKRKNRKLTGIMGL
ncbi:nuclease [bacterium]|jgi:micrococcal nuclease|nr:nuclease [bacterium]